MKLQAATESERCRVSVVIPALNEAKNLQHVLARLPDDIHELIVVDGHSVDDTIAVARQLRPDAVIVEQTRKGKGNALACGFAVATGDIIVTLDADGSADPSEIPQFVEALRNGADFAKGSRFLAGGGSCDITRIRALGNRALCLFVNMLYRTRYTDLCYGYNAFWHRALPVVSHSPLLSPGPNGAPWGDGFEVETLITIRLARAGLKVTEVGSFEHPRMQRKSNLNAVTDGWRVLRTLASERSYQRWSKDRRNKPRPPGLIVGIGERLPRQVTRIALKMAGPQRAHLREAWDSDLLDESGAPLALSKRLRHVGGYVPAAIRCRIDDLAAILLRTLDAVLISRVRTGAMVGMLFGTAVDMIFSRKGLYGLLINAPALAALFAALCAGVGWLRKWRGVELPNEKKDRSQ